MLKNLYQAIQKFGLFKKGEKILLGVSGGSDSIGLLYALNAIKERFDLKIYVAHLDHMIRKKDSLQDKAFVEAVCRRLKLPFYSASVDIARISKEKKVSLEQAGRDERYRFFFEVAKELGIKTIALAHTLDDQVETIFMRLIRGCGLLGLGGIPIVRRTKGFKIIRPLILITKAEVIKYLKKKRINFRNDITNLDTRFFRNKVRHRLIPYIRRYFGYSAIKNIANTGMIIQPDYEFILRYATKRLRRYLKEIEDGYILDMDFIKEDVSLQRMFFRLTIEKLQGALNRIDYTHWLGFNSLLECKKDMWSYDLPGDIIVKKMGSKLKFQRKRIQPKDKGFTADLRFIKEKLNIPGILHLRDKSGVIKAELVEQVPNFRYKSSHYVEYFDLEKLILPLLIRFRRPSDRMVPLGMRNKKRLKEIFIDEKISLHKRDRTPIVLSGDKVIWVCGVKRSNSALVGPNTKKIVKLSYRPSTKEK